MTLDSTPTAFTSFDDITANSLVEADAASSVNYRADVVGGDPEVTGDLTFDGSSVRLLSGDPSDPLDPTSDPEFGGLRLNVDNPAIERDFEDDPTAVGGGAAASRYVAYEIDDGGVTDRLQLNDPENNGFEFMTFGLWEVDIGEASVDIGGAAWGALTPTAAGPTSMPTAGTATYTGDLIGYNVVAGATETYVADSTIAADFGAGTVTLSSSGTVDLATATAAPGFDLAATTGAITGNGFSGTGLTIAALPGQAGDPTGGSFGGNFFGDSAAEAGGWFEVRNVGNNDRFFGSFGGDRGAITP